MESRLQETKLRNEIKYLSRLISAHKAIKSLQTTETISSTMKSIGKQDLKSIKYCSKTIATPSWSHPGSISSHPSLVLKATPNSPPPSLILVRNESSKKSTPSHNDSVQSMDVSLIEGGMSPLLPLATTDKEEKRKEEQLKIGSKRRIQVREKEERIDSNELKNKKMRIVIPPSNSCSFSCSSSSLSNSKNKYVWKGNMKNNKDSTSQKQSKLKWRATPLTSLSSLHQDQLLSDGVTKVTKTCNTITASTCGNRKRRRRSSSGHGLNEFNNSPFIVKRYKLLRVSATQGESPGSFSQRRLHYIKKLSSHSPVPSRQPKRRRLSSSAKSSPVTIATAKRGSIHKVWVPSIGTTPKKRRRISGLEIKTKQGNKQWLSSALVKEKAQLKNEKKSIRQGSDGRGLTDGVVKTKRRKSSKQVSLQDGGKYLLSKNGKSMKKISLTKFTAGNSKGCGFKRRSLATPSKSSKVKILLANNAIQKSVNKVWLAKKHTNWSPTSSRYCVFYNRFGRCNRGKDCTFIHDPKRIAVCSKFLRGKCNQTDGSCPFSHDISKEKMPVCSFFLRGVCTRDNCPYLHVSVGANAEMCQEFMKGYCPMGEKCKKQHTLTCPNYSKDGTCPRGKYCPLRHYRKKLAPLTNNETTPTEVPPTKSKIPAIKEPYAFKKLRRRGSSSKDSTSVDPPTPTIITPRQLDFIPLDTSKMPEFIAL